MMMIASRSLALVAFMCLSVTVSAAPLNEIVENLPDYGSPPTTHFSGYLNATEGCDVEANGECYLHYWMAMAEEDAANKPLVMWLNGGPGSSSILGFLMENGPMLINATGKLMDNPWGWTKAANVIALEQPVGVGYSYCTNQLRIGKPCKNTDKYTASASRAALQDFFNNKFPELARNDFFITGESYAGVYIPTITKEILDNAPEINIKGIGVGDPCTDNKAQSESMDSLWYGYKYGLVDPEVFDQLWNHCEARSPNLLTQGGKHFAAAKWNEHLKEKRVEFQNDDDKLRTYARKLLDNLMLDAGPRFHETPECRLAFRKFLMSSSAGLSQGWKDLYIDDYSLFSPVTNQEEDDMAAYMMRPDVRKALHVESSNIKSWPHDPFVGFDYTKEYDACNWGDIPDNTPSMIDFYKNIVPRLKVTWIYNGDSDPCLSYEGTRAAVKQFGFEELDGGGYRPWFYNQSKASLEFLAEKAPRFGPNLLAQNVGAQMGGEVVNYEHGLSFLTLHGSGHMVPEFRPQAALHFLDRLVNYKDLSPPFPSNKTLTEMDDDSFDDAMNDWTESAKKAPYVTHAAWDHKAIENKELKEAMTELLGTKK